ncbi:MAG: ATP synthase F0 subunit B [Bacillota bacterium]
MDLTYMWPLFNLVLLAVLAFHFGRKPVARFIRSYEQDVDESLDQAEKNRQEAEERLEDCRRRWKSIDAEVERMQRRGEEAGEESLRRALQRAQDEEEHLKSRVTDTIERDRDRALTELRERMADILVRSVSDSMAKLVTPEDHRHISRRFIAEVGDDS